MFREREKKFVNDDFLLNNTSIWKGKKNHENPPLCTFKDLSFSYGNLDQAARQTVITIFLILPCRGLSIPDILYHQFSVFYFGTSFSILTYPTPTIQQINIAWLMMWSTLHVSLYCKTLCITTMVDGRRGREKRGILNCSVVFNASNKKRIPQYRFVPRNSSLSCRTLENGNFNKLLGSRKLVREIDQKNFKNSKKYEKCLS